MRNFLAAFRFLSVAAIAFFLLGPLLKSIEKTEEKPVIVFAQDNSESIVLNKDSSFIKNEYLSGFNQLLDEFSDDYDIVKYSFGETIERDGAINFSDKQTDISLLMDEIYNRFSNRNLGAVLLSSDGIYNRGANPIYQSQKFECSSLYHCTRRHNGEKRLIDSKRCTQ